MKKVIIIALTLLPLTLFAQSNDFNYYYNEVGKTVKSEIDAQVRREVAKIKQEQSKQAQTLTRQNQAQTTQQQAVESYTNKMSVEGQQRMEYYNNPDNYIDRSITNRRPSFNSSNNNQNSYSSGYSPQGQRRDLRTESIHSENLNSKSLQLLREANRDVFSNENREAPVNHDVIVPLFDAPSLGVPLWQDLEEEMDMEAVYSELSPEQKETYDKKKKEIMERIENLEFEARVAKFDAGVDRAVEENSGATFYDNLRLNRCEERIAQEEEKLRQLDDSVRRIVRKKLKEEL